MITDGLGPGEERHLCEIDCHLAYSVVAARTAPTVGTGSARQIATGVFEIVTVHARFDSLAISSRRGLYPFWPNAHWIHGS